jgi:hypothetical protein
LADSRLAFSDLLQGLIPMKQFSLRSLAYLAVLAGVSFSTDLYAGWSDWFASNDTISFPEIKKNNSAAPAAKFAATIHASKFIDNRVAMQPRNIGISTSRIVGISGNDLVLDREVADLVTGEFRKRFDDAGFQFVEDGSAMYELSGIIKELTYNVKAQDEISISIETTLKEIATGKVVWSGIVVEKDKRFAGVSGNSKNDVATYLRYKIGIVTKKSYDAISGSLVASRPDLFNVVPGTKPVAGVTVLFTPEAGQPASSIVPVVSVMTPSKSGMLVLTSKLARAKVYLEGVYFGMSPLRAEVEAGIHNVSIKLDGYKTATEKLSVRKDETTELEMVLEK